MRQMMAGYEAIAHACIKNGVSFVAGYPGYPCIEIVEEIKKNENVYCEWSANEKVALDACVGASYNGKRALVTMKTVGLNVASDTFFAASGARIRGGLVLAICDDIGRLAGDDMCDSREYALAAKLPLLVPGDAQESYDFIEIAYTISEQLHVPVVLRLSSVVTHTIMSVETTDGIKKEEQGFGDTYQYIPRTITGTIADFNTNSKLYHVMERGYVDYIKRESQLLELCEDDALCKEEINRRDIGFVCCGTTYCFAKEAYPEASFLRLGMCNPIPRKKIEKFFSDVKDVFVLEDGKRLIERKIRSWGLPVRGDKLFSRESKIFRFDIDLIKKEIERYYCNEERKEVLSNEMIPYRLPVNCAGCSHRVVFYVLKKLGIKVLGDSGCFTLNIFPPMNGIDCFVCLGAGIGLMHGYEKGILGRDDNNRVVSVSGDGGFLHSGINSLMNVALNKGCSTYIILDNNGLAMTGGHETPATGRNIYGKTAKSFNIRKFCRILDIEFIELDSYDLKEMERVIDSKCGNGEPTVIVIKHACNRRFPIENKETLFIDYQKCIGCGKCLEQNCLALCRKEDTESIIPVINSTACTNCGVCVDVCPTNAFVNTPRGEK